MIMNKKIGCLLFGLWWHAVQAQVSDSLRSRDLEEIVVTATRTERAWSALPMPVMRISAAQIRQMGSLRLQDVLREQTGLAVVTDHGQGIQMQGLQPDYTLILIDGEPLIGRTAGTLDLSRVAVANIRQIEIIKGPSSSLYGSEALAGVINIITERPTRSAIQADSRYGTNQTTDLSLQASLLGRKWRHKWLANRYSSAGYDLSPQTVGQTVAPFAHYTFQYKTEYPWSDRCRVEMAVRYTDETQQQRFWTDPAGIVRGQGHARDWNLLPVVHLRGKNHSKTQVRLYHTGYSTRTDLSYERDGQQYEQTFFEQRFWRPEVQHEYWIRGLHALTAGTGIVAESVEATRYPGRKSFANRYLFVQQEWAWGQRWTIVAGARLDAHTVYGTQLSPKFSARYQLHRHLILRGSWGTGFKAPDFRQLYLNFHNAIAGYAVYGSEELAPMLDQLMREGQVAEVFFAPGGGHLRAERSRAINLGLRFMPSERWTCEINYFRHDISNLIESQVFARRTNGQNIFSYRNVSEVFTQGIEADLACQWSKSLRLSAGYQWLVAKDKQVLGQIARGELFARDPQTLVTRRVTAQEYGGLFGRSRHMYNFRLFYTHPRSGWEGSLRGVYRGRYGLADLNGNLILDRPDEYIDGYWTVHLTCARTIGPHLCLQAGIDNLLDQRDQNIPNLPGRLLWGSLQIRFPGKS